MTNALEAQITPKDIMEAVRENRPFFMRTGLAMVVIGALAILFPVVGSIAVKVFIGWFFLLAGGALLYHAFQTREWQSAIWTGFIAIMYLALGVYLTFFQKQV